MAQATLKHGNPLMVDHTPSSAVSAGDVVVIDDVVAIAHLDTPANTLGALSYGPAVYTVTADAAIVAGSTVYWNDTNNKVTETSSGNKLFGKTVDAAAADGDLIDVVLTP